MPRGWELPDGSLVDATDWSPTWGQGAGQMISNFDDRRVWAPISPWAS